MTRLFLLLRDAILSEVLWQQTRWHLMRRDQHRRAARRHAARMRECGDRALALGDRAMEGLDTFLRAGPNEDDNT